jgi:hypothetical protein
MSLADGMVRSVNRAFHEAKASFSGVEMQEAAKPYLFIFAMIEGTVTCENSLPIDS